MAEEFYIPKLGQTVEEVTIIKWNVEDGAQVERGQEILEVETDKAIFPIEANANGFIHLGPYKEGDVVPVLEVVAIIGDQEDIFEVKQPRVEQASVPGPTLAIGESGVEKHEPAVVADRGGGRVFASPRARKMARERRVNLSFVSAAGEGGARITESDVIDYLARLPNATPVARKMAVEHGLDLSAVSTVEKGGRITKADVERAIQLGLSEPLGSSRSGLNIEGMDISKRVPLRGVRGIIADRLGKSSRTAARVTLMMEVDATKFVELRAELKMRVEETWGFAPGFNDLLGKIVAESLKAYPYMNARLTPEAIEYLSKVNLGMAVDTDRGLIVPVIRDADHKSLKQFAMEFRALVERVHNNRALPDDLTGGTFTITNLGMYDVDAFTPIINLPEAAILGFGRVHPRLRMIEGEIIERQFCTLSLAFDHRVVDGAPAARFLQHIKDNMEEPPDWFTEI